MSSVPWYAWFCIGSVVTIVCGVFGLAWYMNRPAKLPRGGAHRSDD